jgi:hypothetical protein
MLLFRYCARGWVKEVFYHSGDPEDDICFLSSRVLPSMSLNNQPHRVWIAVKRDRPGNPGGEIVCCYCTCTAGYAFLVLSQFIFGLLSIVSRDFWTSDLFCNTLWVYVGLQHFYPFCTAVHMIFSKNVGDNESAFSLRRLSVPVSNREANDSRDKYRENPKL